MEHSGHERDAPGIESQAWCLSVHAAYRCRHSGACCTAGWTIPVEALSFETLARRYAGEVLFETGVALPEGAAAMLRIRPDGGCVFFEKDAGNLCRVHRELGESMLPVACRQFPRVVLHDGRGMHISLSHYCPTAASLLLQPGRLQIVRAPSNVALDGAAEGLDARDALPPLLRPGMLMDLESYDAWERCALEVLARDELSPEQAIATIHSATCRIADWRPGATSLCATVRHQFEIASRSEADEDTSADVDRVNAVVASVPGGLTRPPVDPGFPDAWAAAGEPSVAVQRAFRAYLAAKLFGNWIAYHGQGLHAIVEYSRASLAVLKMECVRIAARSTPAASPWQNVISAIRNSDLLLVHLSDPKDLARRLS